MAVPEEDDDDKGEEAPQPPVVGILGASAAAAAAGSSSASAAVRRLDLKSEAGCPAAWPQFYISVTHKESRRRKEDENPWGELTQKVRSSLDLPSTTLPKLLGFE
eukprot:TRINITY_DN15005_c0_g1_i1.p1 TRINITY_DN15005_c0_g1~~TRINITY_DN15005_c0_g1_i1.p1  ORF type:complete len:105 (+),score=21.74 TRINITY_DN15005_c0_g1_i1:126-440(+)